LSSLCALSKFSVTTCLGSDAPKGSKLEFETSGKLRGTTLIAAQKGTTVTVEGLFKNLPVRRRELERNIKREWSKVINLLNQYACILIGVKFSVSQQPNKGKKIVLFSTRGNPTTRENIVNVFGAKTLAVLIPLELDLELEPTSAPSQRGTIPADTNSKNVKIRGHVSRPVHGEGRQTPDRQMFFVNGRPCGLPQFAKVFNEVYKSYNSSQSPFIFADIQLDTHMYDVNVSPDKRTILLHDQARLLDNLRESLIALFETQDYSVPLAQLGGTTQTPFKKPVISRGDIAETDVGNAKRTSIIPKDGNLVRPNSQEERRNLVDQHQNDFNKEVEMAQIKHPVPERSHAHASRYAERKSDDYPEEPESSVPSGVSAETETLEWKETRRLAHTEQRPPGAGPRDERTAETLDIEAGCPRTSEPPIPSLSTPHRTSEIKNVRWTPSRAKRIAPEIATITIDGDTVTSLISSPTKRVRTEKPGMSSPQPPRNASKSVASVPSFRGRLSQMFSASSTSKSGSKDIPTTRLVDGPSRSTSLSDASSASDGLFIGSDQDSGEAVSSPAPSDQAGEDRAVDLADGKRGTAAQRALNQRSEDDGASDFGMSESDSSLNSDDEFANEEAKKAREENKVQDMINTAEDAAKTTYVETQRRQSNFIKGTTTRRKDATCQLLQMVRMDAAQIGISLESLEKCVRRSVSGAGIGFSGDAIGDEDAEEKLSLTISKSDFGKMKIIGQFNLGFILAVRHANADSGDLENQHAVDDELFIIDQHATDEKYNFERLQAVTVVQSQRLVHPKALELTAIEEEVVKENIEALENNGFQVSIDESGYQPVGSRCQLLSLPLSRETTFTLADLEELISLLTDHQSMSSNTIPRPSKVRKMFAMRACRSSVMIGRSLSNKQMEKLLRHMGELDKPWNCPHGRPTMRHLCGLGAWNDSVWQEGDGANGEPGAATDWAAYVKRK
jgi:DNA mismatch repair protein PMS2